MIEPKSGHVSKIGPEFKGKYKWLRGVPAPDGAVYCLPCHAESVLRIDCTTAPPTITTIGAPLVGMWKWHGGVLSPYDQCIYAIPQFAESVLKIDTRSQTVSTIGGPFPGASPTGKHKWYATALRRRPRRPTAHQS